MSDRQFESKILEDAVDAFAQLPGIGKRSALRLVLHLLKQDSDDVRQFANNLVRLKEEVKYCKVCNNLSDDEVCSICSNKSREANVICVVETIRDVIAIESTHQYFGSYHVLGGVISPMDGIGPSDLSINKLIDRVQNNPVEEIIFALSTTMEGDTTNFFLYKKLKDFDVKITTIARGVSFGDEIQYADEVTLGQSIIHRQEFSHND